VRTAAHSLSAGWQADVSESLRREAMIGESYKCKECGSPYNDAAMPSSLSENNALCSWCFLEKYSDASRFLAVRGIGELNSRVDKRILAAQTHLHRWAKKKLDDYASFDGWYSCLFYGKSYGTKWNNYLVEFVGIPSPMTNVVGMPLHCGTIYDAPIYYDGAEFPPEKDVLYVCRTRIFYKFSLAYLEILYDNFLSKKVSIENCVYANTNELKKVYAGLDLFHAVKDKRGGSEKDYSLDLLLFHYKKTLEKTSAASNIYKSIKLHNLPDWQRIIKQKSIDMPDDLINRLPGALSILSMEEQSTITEKGHEVGTPSHIAAEWASRLCKVPAYHYSYKTLETILTKLRKQEKTNLS
jgi:hypothetical protein